MPKTKTEKPWLTKWLPEWANERLTFAVHPGEALRRCARNKVPPKAKLTPKRRR